MELRRHERGRYKKLVFVANGSFIISFGFLQTPTSVGAARSCAKPATAPSFSRDALKPLRGFLITAIAVRPNANFELFVVLQISAQARARQG